MTGKYIRTVAHRAAVGATFTKHGMAGKDSQWSSTYRAWSAMRRRCFNAATKDYPLYGGRGITVCERWKTFENFLEDMGVRPEGKTLDRINNDGNYEPGNCRWATWSEQRVNQRRMK